MSAVTSSSSSSKAYFDYENLSPNLNGPGSMRRFGFKSSSPKATKRDLCFASLRGDRTLKDSSTLMAKAFEEGKAELKSGFHRGGFIHSKTGEPPDERVHLTVKVKKGGSCPEGMYHIRYDHKGRVIQVRR